MELVDRVAVVTGGGTDIGRANGRAAPGEERRVDVCARIDPDPEEAAEETVESVRRSDRGTASEAEIRHGNP